ncbi:MAG: hypothetical protein ISS16_10590 [Ignavibacteria bacterium]|nr:hypothetical protein [Ignavibacteria bacterium]
MSGDKGAMSGDKGAMSVNIGAISVNIKVNNSEKLSELLIIRTFESKLLLLTNKLNLCQKR